MAMDCARVAEYLAEWIRGRVSAGGARGVLVGVSGGVDSAVVAALAARAMPGRVLGLATPAHSDPEDVEDAKEVAEALGVPLKVIDLSPLFDLALETFERSCGDLAGLESLRIGPAARPGEERPPSRGRPSAAEANLKPRLRMIAIYYFANRLNYLVAGTGNRSEIHVGYFTKHGDGGVDILPIGGLVKAQVWELARFLALPERVVSKVPSAGLWKGQTDEGEMGLAYLHLDEYLLTGRAPLEVRERIDSMHSRSEHKRRRPPIAEIPPDMLG